MSSSPADSFSSGAGSPGAVFDFGFAPAAAPQHFDGTEHRAQNQQQHTQQHQCTNTAHSQENGPWISSQSRPQFPVLSSSSSRESLRMTSAMGRGSARGSRLNSSTTSPARTHSQPGTPQANFSNQYSTLQPSPLSPGWPSAMGGPAQGAPSHAVAFSPQHQPTVRHAHSASAPTFNYNSASTYPQLHPSPNAFNGQGGWIGSRPVHAHHHSFDSSVALSPHSFTTSHLTHPAQTAPMYAYPPQGSEQTEFALAHARHPSTDSNVTNASSAAPLSVASPASSIFSHSSPRQPLPGPHSVIWSAGQEGESIETAQGGGASQGNDGSASGPTHDYHNFFANANQTATFRMAPMSNAQQGSRTMSGPGGAAAFRFAQHSASALAPMLTAHRPNRAPPPPPSTPAPIAVSPATPAFGIRQQPHQPQSPQEAVSPRTALSQELGGMMLSSQPSQQQPTHFVSSPLPVTPAGETNHSPRESIPSPQTFQAPTPMSNAASPVYWSAGGGGGSLSPEAAGGGASNALGLTSMHSTEPSPGGGGTIGSSDGWGAESAPFDWGQGGVNSSAPIFGGGVGGGGKAQYDERRISPITGRPTKIATPRGWPPKDQARRIYHCPVAGCGKVFGRPSAKETHLRSHSGVKPYACPIPECARPFSVFSNLKRHMVVHPCTDFRSISVHDLTRFTWVPRSPGQVAGLRWLSNGALIGSGLLDGMDVTARVSVARRGLKPRQARPRKSKRRVKADSDEEYAEEEDGGWGPGGSDAEEGDGDEGGSEDERESE